MNLDHNSVVVLTGAASGIGRSIAKRLSAQGCRLALSDWNEADLAQLVTELARPEAELVSAAFDMADRDAVATFADQVTTHFDRVDCVINNAGVGLAQKVIDTDYDDLKWVMDINFYGMVYGCNAFLPTLLNAGQGKVVFVSSAFGIVGIPTQSGYSASKFAIRGFAESLREEIRKQGVDVLVVCPGGIKTNIVSSGRIKDPNAFGKSNEDPAKRFERLARTTADEACDQIIKAIETDQQRVLIGKDAKLLDRLQRLFPGSYHAKLRSFTRLISRRK